jgi:hypothetical protein
MPGPHYAISEALIVIAAIVCAVRLSRHQLWLAAFGSFIFGTAAAIGVVRFGFSLDKVEQLAVFHRDFSQSGGAIAMALMSAQLLLASSAIKRMVHGKRSVGFAIVVTALFAIAIVKLATILFIAWLLLAIVMTFLIPARSLLIRFSTAAMTALFLVNLLFIRRSPALGPDLSWHMFHILVALWLVGMLFIYQRQARFAEE